MLLRFRFFSSTWGVQIWVADISGDSWNTIDLLALYACWNAMALISDMGGIVRVTGVEHSGRFLS